MARSCSSKCWTRWGAQWMRDWVGGCVRASISQQPCLCCLHQLPILIACISHSPPPMLRSGG